MRNQVFISYSHSDREWLDRLQIHLKPLERKSSISVWDDTRILSGAKWKDTITNALASAKVAILLVSPNFLASDFIANEELLPLLQAAENEGLTILWIAVSASLYNETEIGNYQAANNPTEPLDSLSPSQMNVALVKIVERVKAAMEREAEPPPAPIARAPVAAVPSESVVASASQGSAAAVETDAMKIALLYKRNAKPDEDLLQQLEVRLSEEGFNVFIDRHMSIGVEWAKEIEQQVRNSEAVIPLLSPASMVSEMVAYEIQIAHDEAQKRHGKPRLLPIRVGYEGPISDPIGSILAPLQYALWEGPEDTERMVSELINSLRHPPVAERKRQRLESIGGAVPLDSEFYIVRETDDDFCSAIARHDSIVLVKGARQMGKTSLLARGLQQARKEGAKIVLTDFQRFNAEHMESVESFFLTLAEMVEDQLDLDVSPEDVWNTRRGPSINFERYIRREVLNKIPEHIVWGLDEVDRLFTTDYGSEVFGLFRSWHNERSLDPTGPWQRLTLAISYATEAHLFITDLNQSPFNVGTRLVIEDFTREQIADLNDRYGSPLGSGDEVSRFHGLVGGQPYLVRRGLYELVNEGIGLAQFEAVADRDEGPFGDHLRRFLVLLAQDEELCDVVRELLRGKPSPDDESFYRLRSAGLMTGASSNDARPRCRLYATYLGRHLL